MVNVLGVHHSPALWKDPDQFNPSRFLHKTPDSDMVQSWMAFGGGPRACLGINFSLLEQKLFLWMFLERFEVMEYPGYERKQPVIGLQKLLNLKVVLKRRSPSVAATAE